MLSIKASRSNYINPNNLPITPGVFPNMRLEEMETGHWVHSEKPGGSVDLVASYIKGIAKGLRYDADGCSRMRREGEARIIL